MRRRVDELMQRLRWAGVLAVVSSATLPAAVSAAVEVRVLSNRADLISGGEALVEIAGAGTDQVRVGVGGRDVTEAFVARENGRLQGLVTGLRTGANVLRARLPDGSGARITITNHPIGGPVFSGPQVQPWTCTTVQNGLGPPLDDQCNTPPRVTYLYKSTNPLRVGLQPYDPARPPTDVATTDTGHAGRLPFIVRHELGVANRGIYEFLVLADPKQPWTPSAPQKGWNGKLYWSFGGDCTPKHVQSSVPPFPLDITGGGARIEAVLAQGFATGASSGTNLGTNCNSVVSAETLMMVKERIVETLGPIRYTMSEGLSGGAMQQHWIVSNYSGLLDGIQPSASFPDIWEAIKEAEDCHVLDHYFDAISPLMWLVIPQQDAVTGYAASLQCRLQFDGPRGSRQPLLANYAEMWMDPANAAGCGLPAGEVYHPQVNRSGARCTVQDYMVSIFGRRASDGFANFPYDNVGVQYGLVALKSGRISPEQFVDLNEKVGGLSVDWGYQPQRSRADVAAVRTMHRAGLVTYPREAAKVPIIDLRATSNYDIHTDFHSYAMRARLRNASGHADNQIIWSSLPPSIPDSTTPGDGTIIATSESISLLDRWLSRIEADRSDRTLEEKVLRHRPADAVDACWFAGVKETNLQTCRAAFPVYSVPRVAAGAPQADDIVRCELKPPDRGEYGVRFTDDQWARLRRAFPDGVCDYSRPGVAQEPSIPWMSFAAGPGGRPLGDPPRSTSLRSAGALEPACASAAGFRSVAAQPRGGGLRFDVDRFQGRPFGVEVLQQSTGRRVLGDRLVVGLADRIEPFTWDGRAGLSDGHYLARFTMALDDGVRDVRHVALRRRGGRFLPAPAFAQRVACGAFRSLRLSSSAFGGTTHAPLGIVVALARRADRLTVVARSGKRAIKRWRIARPGAGRVFRLRLPARAVRPGRSVHITATAVRGSRRFPGERLTARRL